MAQEPKSNGKTMKTLKALLKRSKKKSNRDYWRAAIDGLAGRDAYISWLEKQK